MLKVNFYATLRSIVGQKTIMLELPNDTALRDILNHLFEDYPRIRGEILTDEGEIQHHVSIFINGRDVRYLNDLDSTLNDTQVLDIFPPVAGG